MAGMPTQKPDRCYRTICLPIDEPHYSEIVSDAGRFREWLTEQFELHPELFPELFARGFSMNDRRVSSRTGIVIRRIALRDGTAWSVRPSFVLPGMSKRSRQPHRRLRA